MGWAAVCGAQLRRAAGAGANACEAKECGTGQRARERKRPQMSHSAGERRPALASCSPCETTRQARGTGITFAA